MLERIRFEAEREGRRGRDEVERRRVERERRIAKGVSRSTRGSLRGGAGGGGGTGEGGGVGVGNADKGSHFKKRAAKPANVAL